MRRHEVVQRIGPHVGGGVAVQGGLLADIVGAGPVPARDGPVGDAVGRGVHPVVGYGLHELARRELGRRGGAGEEAAHVHEHVAQQHADEQEVQPSHARGRAMVASGPSRAAAAEAVVELAEQAVVILAVAPVRLLALGGEEARAGAVDRIVPIGHLRVNLRFEHPDVGEVAVALGVIQAVADHEIVRAVHAHVLRVDGGLLAGDVLPQEGRDLQRGGVAA